MVKRTAFSQEEFYFPLSIITFTSFQIKETSSINASGSGGYANNHREVTDAMESAVNHLANASIGDTVTITHTITLKRTQ